MELGRKHFRSILGGQIVNFFFTLQGEALEPRLSNFDGRWRRFLSVNDKLDYRQVKQGLQEFGSNMECDPVGFQTPFTNVTLDLKVPEFMKVAKPVVIGGKLMVETYGDFQVVISSIKPLPRLWRAMWRSGSSPSPIPTYNITEDFALDDLDKDLGNDA